MHREQPLEIEPVEPCHVHTTWWADFFAYLGYFQRISLTNQSEDR